MFGRRKKLKSGQLPLSSVPLTQNNQNSNSAIVPQNDSAGALALRPQSPFEQPVVLKQSPIWSRFILWIIVLVVTCGVGWAYFAEIEQVVSATGQLKPKDAVKTVQAPLEGVVEDVRVEDGDDVKKGEVLLTFDTTSEEAELKSALEVKKSLEQENIFYRGLIEAGNAGEIREAITELDLPANVMLLTRNRDELAAENRVYRAQLASNAAGLSADQQARLEAAEVEARSRENAAKLEIAQIQQQIQENQVRLADARQNLQRDRQILVKIQQRANNSLAQAQQSLALEQQTLQRLSTLNEQSAIPNIQYQQQLQAVNDRKAQLQEIRDNARIEIEQQQQQIETRQAEIARLQEEQSRFKIDAVQGGEELVNTTVSTTKDVREAIAKNEQAIANIDSQLVQAILNVLVENEKRINELNSQISQLQQRRKYRQVRASISGTIFDLQAYDGFVANPSEKLLDIVPQDTLVAEVFINNQDIGFVNVNTPVDVRIDSFPFSEFGQIEGTITKIGSDALPPDEVHQFYRFPATIELKTQKLIVKDGGKASQETGKKEDLAIDLQSGMSISANIKIRENRKVIDLFLEMFTDQVESLKETR